MVPGDLHSRHEEELRKIRKKKKYPELSLLVPLTTGEGRARH